MGTIFLVIYISSEISIEHPQCGARFTRPIIPSKSTASFSRGVEMCRSLLAVAFLLLLDSLLFSVLVSGDIFGDVSDGKNEPSQAAPCLPNITSNGVPLNVTISRVLSSPKVLPCADTISKALNAMFQLGKLHKK